MKQKKMEGSVVRFAGSRRMFEGLGQLWCQFEVENKVCWLWWILLGLLVLRLVGHQSVELGMV